MDVRPLAPGLVVDREACRLALFRGERRDEGPRGFQDGRQREAGLFESEKSRDDLTAAGDSAEGFGKTRVGASSIGFRRGGRSNGRIAGVGGLSRKPKCADFPATLGPSAWHLGDLTLCS